MKITSGDVMTHVPAQREAVEREHGNEVGLSRLVSRSPHYVSFSLLFTSLFFFVFVFFVNKFFLFTLLTILILTLLSVQYDNLRYLQY